MSKLPITLTILTLSRICDNHPTTAEKHPDNLTVVHWNTSDYSIEQKQHSEVHRWHNYIDSIIKQRFNTRLNMRDTYESLASDHECLRVFEYVQPVGTTSLSVPCRNIVFSSRDLCNRWWKVSLHHLQSSINVTIHKAFVAFSVHCYHQNDFIAVDSSQRTRRGGKPGGASNVAVFCGHVNMESMFSKWSEVRIQVKSSGGNIKYPALLVASYAAMGRGVAYMWYKSNTRFANHNRLIPSLDNIDLRPNRVLFANQLVIAIWYMVNDFVEQFDSKAVLAEYKEDTLFRYHQIRVTLENCTESSTSIMIYAGLQSWQRMRWKEKPVEEIYCNTTDFTINTTFHMYTTLTLKHLYTDRHINLRLSIPTKMELMQENGLSSALPSYLTNTSSLSVLKTPKSQRYISFVSFEYPTDFSTVACHPNIHTPFRTYGAFTYPFCGR